MRDFRLLARSAIMGLLALTASTSSGFAIVLSDSSFANVSLTPSFTTNAGGSVTITPQAPCASCGAVSFSRPADGPGPSSL